MTEPEETPGQTGPKTGAGPTYAQQDVSLAARRSLMRTDHHTAQGQGRAIDPYGRGDFATGGLGHSGYGGDYGTLEGSSLHERRAHEAGPPQVPQPGRAPAAEPPGTDFLGPHGDPAEGKPQDDKE